MRRRQIASSGGNTETRRYQDPEGERRGSGEIHTIRTKKKMMVIDKILIISYKKYLNYLPEASDGKLDFKFFKKM